MSAAPDGGNDVEAATTQYVDEIVASLPPLDDAQAELVGGVLRDALLHNERENEPTTP